MHDQLQEKYECERESDFDLPELMEFKWQLDSLREKVKRYYVDPDTCLKNAKLSDQLKLQGNQFLKEKKLHLALDFYNEVRKKLLFDLASTELH
jgi:hypothetical protein